MATHLGVSLYTEDTTIDTTQLMEQMAESNLGPYDQVYELTHIQRVLRILEPILIQSSVNHNELVPLAIELGRRATKLELTTGESTVSTLRHVYGTYRVANDVISSGGLVYLIESCNSKGQQVVSDIDILYTEKGMNIAADYTQKRTNERNTIYTWNEREQYAKYKKLRMFPIDNSVPKVISYNFNEDYFTLAEVTINKYVGCPREADFKFVDNCMKAYHNMTWPQAVSVINVVADQYKDFGEGRSEMVQTPGIYTSRESYDKSLMSIKTNGVESGKLYDTFLSEMAHSRLSSLNTRAHSNRYFSSETTQRLLESDTRWHIPMNEVRRGNTERSPFLRIKQTANLMTSNGVLVDSWTMMLALLVEKDVVVLEDVPNHYILPLIDHTCYLEFRRVYNKAGDKVDAYKVSLRKNPVFSTMDQLIESMRTKMSSTRTKHDGLEQLETEYVDYREMCLGKGQGSYMIDDVEGMIHDVMEDGHLSTVTRSVMLKSLKTISNTKLLSMIAQTQEITQCLLTGARKRKLVSRNVGSLKSQMLTFGLTCLSDREGVVSHNLGPLTFGQFKDTMYMVHGNFTANSGPWVKEHLASITTPLTMSPSMLDWNITVLHKAVSWAALRYETCITHFPEQHHLLATEMILPLSLVFLNSNTFSQAADLCRYFFVNGVGFTSGVGPLFEKLSWYQPKTTLEKLYMVRMMKMSDMLSVSKALGCTHDLVSKSRTKLDENHGLKMTVTVEGWAIAMPDEENHYLAQQHTFNSFYNSRALSIQRYQKVLSEALVVNKQLDARESYLSVKRAELPHEGRFLDDYERTTEELVEELKDFDYVTCQAMQFSPSPQAIFVGGIATLLKVKKDEDLTIGDTVTRAYSCDEVHRRMKVSDVMNNRGSVRDSKTNGLVVTRTTKVSKKNRKITQNSKCYRTVLALLNKFMKGEKPSQVPPNYSFVVDQYPDEDDMSELLRLVEMPENLSVILAWLVNNHGSCISKMVHKDQLGAREIAVLNAIARIMCRYVEDISRHIRDSDLRAGLTTNLIEVSEKRDIVLMAKRRTDVTKRDRVVFYDSADCSTWGPSMMLHALYQTIMIRYSGDKSIMLRNCLSLFSSKVFKIPDELYLASKSFDLTTPLSNQVNTAMHRIRTMDFEMGQYSKQIIHLEESMHQGILGVSSSVFGSDAQELSNYISERVNKSIGLKITSFTTSDDYARIQTWDRSAGAPVYATLKNTLSQHVDVMRLYGIKRNLQKSTFSPNYFEFNSEFFTSMGEMKPDIKSRLSFIDMCPEVDPFPIAQRPMNQASEFLRSEGSFIGACWVFVLNNCLAMYQNQSRSLWKQHGRDIYHIPLELGGLIRPDPLKASCSHPSVGMLQNYCATDPETALKRMLDLSPFGRELQEINVDIDEDGKLVLPSFSRSGSVHLCRRPQRQTRALREFLLSAPESIFADVYHSRYSSTIVLSLMACAQRESSSSEDEGAARRFMVTQTPSTVPLYRINSYLLSTLTAETKLSRQSLHNLADLYLTTDFPSLDIEIPIDLQQINNDLRVLSDTETMLQPNGMCVVPRIGHTHVRRQTFTTQTYVYDKFMEFEEVNLPRALGGHTDIHPWMFLESRMTYSNFLNKLSMRKQLFRLVLREKDQSVKNFPEILLSSNFMAGCRLQYDYNPTAAPRRVVDTHLLAVLSAIEDTSVSFGGNIVVDIMSQGLPALLRTGKVGSVDVSSLMNLLAGD